MIGCTIKKLAPEQMIEWAATSRRINPANAPRGIDGLEPEYVALVTSCYWGSGGVHLGVGFMEQTASALANKILAAMNLWGKTANVQFSLASPSTAQVRISRQPGGYWSYLGNQILHIPKNQQTMNLEAFSLNTPDSEYLRVVCHETGHTLGFPHEHMRKELVALLDPAKTIAYFERTQGWTATEIQQQVLTPLDDSTLLETPVDQTSIMCYEIDGSCTISGQPIPGGTQIDASDAAFAAKIYPQPTAPPPVNPPVQPPTNPPAPATSTVTITGSSLAVAVNGSPVPITVPIPKTGDLMQSIANIIAGFKGLDWSQFGALAHIIASAPPGTIDSLIALARANNIPASAYIAVLWAHKDQLTADFVAVEKAFADLVALFNPPTPTVAA